MDNYFPKFHASLKTPRVLKAYSDPYYLTEGASEIMRDQEARLPHVVYEENEIIYIKTSSYARSPGEGLIRVENMLKNALPSDIKSFFDAYAEALVVTRTYPIHIWPVDRILEFLEDMRYERRYPLRFIRFGDQWERGATQYALWQRDPQKPNWCVVTTSVGEADDRYDDPNLTDYCKLGDSFSDWLEEWIARDGLPDPFMKLGPEGGFLDPV